MISDCEAELILGDGLSDFEEGKMMRNDEKAKGSAVTFFVFAFILCILAFVFAGCKSYAQPGETEAEGRRRHQRNLALNRQQLMADIDMLLLYDKPSKLSDKRIQ